MSSAAVRTLTFHGVGPAPRVLTDGEARVWIDCVQFAAILDGVAGRPDVRLTFDDGNRSDVAVALPALVERGLHATFFVLAGRLGDSDHLGTDDLRTLVAAGMAIGSHGLDHRDWRRCPDADLHAEIGASRDILRDASGADVTEVSVPFGSYDRRVLRALRRDGGYRRVYTSDGGGARSRAWLQPRTSVTAGEDPRAVAAPGPDAIAVAVRRSAKRAVKRWR